MCPNKYCRINLKGGYNMGIVTFNLLNGLFPATDDATLQGFVDPLNHACKAFNINTPLRVAGFLAQVGHESGGLTRMRENLNYSADRLRKVFPKYFPTDQLALAYERQPQKIGARVYANRLGNGPEGSGEGFLYRGRGLIQLTGKATYQEFADAIRQPLANIPAYLETQDGAAVSAGWFWSTRNINTPADRGDIVGMTKLVNGGTNGLDERTALYNKARALLGV